MQIADPIGNAANTFDLEWRHPRLTPLEYNEVYSLFPQETRELPTRANWPDNWPLADCPGVYLVFGAKMQLNQEGGGLAWQTTNDPESWEFGG